MIIRNHPTTPRRGNEQIAQGIALGSLWRGNRPEGAKASIEGMALDVADRYSIMLLPLQGVATAAITPRALPWAVICWPFRPIIGYMRITIFG